MTRSWLELGIPADATSYAGWCMACSTELRGDERTRPLSREELESTIVNGTLDLGVDSAIVHCSRGHEVLVKRLDKVEADLLDEADKIWNRATFPPDPEARSGDRALGAILGFHGLVMNGGLAYALEIGYDVALSACDGSRRLGAIQLARILEEATSTAAPLLSEGRTDMSAWGSTALNKLEALEDRYYELVPDDQALDDMFREYLAAHPNDFAPVQ